VRKDPIDSAVDKAAHDPKFTTEEIELLKRMADAWRGLESFGRLAGAVRRVLVLVGWLAAAWLTFKFAAADWIRGIQQ